MTNSEAALNDEELIKRLREVIGSNPFFTNIPNHLRLIAADRIEELQTKLTKALAALDEAIYLLDPDEEDLAKEAGVYRIVTTYKELKGEIDE
jgi:hypothetical protein